MRVNYKSLTDGELSNKLIVRDDAAFSEIYKRYWGVLYGFARKTLNNDDQAEDVVQEVFANLYERAGDLFQESNISAYLYRSVKNSAIDAIRHDKVKINYVASFKDFYNKGEYTTDNQLREKELKDLIEKEVQNLPPKMRQVFEMSRNAYLTHKEISEITGSTPNTIKKQLRLAIMKLRARLTCLFLFQIMSAILWLNRL